jgi:hypothetical protein
MEDGRCHVAKTMASAMTFAQLMELAKKNVKTVATIYASGVTMHATVTSLVTSISSLVELIRARTISLVVASSTPLAVAGNLRKAPVTPHDVASTHPSAVDYNFRPARAPPLVAALSPPSTKGNSLPKTDDPSYPPKPTPISYVGTVISQMGGDGRPLLIVSSTMGGIVNRCLHRMWVQYS